MTQSSFREWDWALPIRRAVYGSRLLLRRLRGRIDFFENVAWGECNDAKREWGDDAADGLGHADAQFRLVPSAFSDLP
jgi:hypothetical protein